MSRLWRTVWEPLPDITPYEIALDMKYVNASQIVGEYDLAKLGTALRHRVVAERNGQRMSVVAATISSTGRGTEA